MTTTKDTGASTSFGFRDVARMQTFKDIPEKDIESIQAPALILCGNNDVNTVEHAVQMYRKMKKAQLAIFPGGHGDYMGEAVMTTNETRYPELTAGLIEEFLRGA